MARDWLDYVKSSNRVRFTIKEIELVVGELTEEQRMQFARIAIPYRHPIHPTTRREVLERDGATCQLCGQVGAADVDADGFSWHIDHITPVILGGSNALGNLQLACRKCNLRKGAKAL